MKYQSLSLSTFYSKINSEAKARDLLWRYRFGKSGFNCPNCNSQAFYPIKTRPEVRECAECSRQVRLRSGTIFEHSKIPLLIWVRAVYLMTAGKRGISALELQRHLGMSRYETVLKMTRKIRRGLWQRDEGYQLCGLVEVDGAAFGTRASGNQKRVLVAIESRDYVDKKGRLRKKAGFAKVVLARESKGKIEKFVNSSIKSGSILKTDAARVYQYNEFTDYRVAWKGTYADPEILDQQLPWVHKFISNAKAWVTGTHHGISGQHLGDYLAEYTYRFNRRHDVKSMFSRALNACCLASPVRIPAFCG